MKKALYLGKSNSEWGFIETDKNDKLVSACPDFCAHFTINESDWVGVSIKEIVQKVDWYDRKKVFFGIIFGYACLVRIIESNHHYVYRVIVREDDIDVSEMISFMNSIGPTKMKKRSLPKKLYSFEEIIGVSQTIDQVKELAARIATSNSTVLLTGESGTGKELFAQAIHGLSSRKNNSFIAVNCAAIPAELFESELFGYEGGAFSGAKKEGKPGKIELAQNGTLFLDEISELPYPAQGKLLRVLQEREIERLGGTDSKSVDIRIITATNRDLKGLVHEGKFRQDLFYRLFVFDLKIPSLRQRKEDILPLAYSFIDLFNDKLGREVKYIEFMLQEWLLEYEWPGNVRELKAYIERGMNIVEGDTLTLDSLTIQKNSTISAEEQSISLKPLDEEVRNAEIKAIRRALTATKGDRTQAAQLLNIHIASLYRKISKYNLKD